MAIIPVNLIQLVESLFVVQRYNFVKNILLINSLKDSLLKQDDMY